MKNFALPLLLTLIASPVMAKPKYAATTQRAIDSTDFLRKNPAPDFWAMNFHYVAQGENMCQTASMAMVFNALKNGQDPDSETKNITQPDLVKKVNDAEWVKAMKIKKCFSLDRFSELVRKALNLYFGEGKFSVRVVHVDSLKPSAIEKYLEDFSKNEESANDLILANFDQAVFTGEAEAAGHISPIGAYDRASKRFLILDVDREWYTPYWVPQDQFFKGLASQDGGAKKARGYIVISPTRD